MSTAACMRDISGQHTNLNKVSLSNWFVDETGTQTGRVEGSLHNCCIAIAESDPWLNHLNITP